MRTEFGKYVKKLRVDRDELLGDMSEKLGVTSSFLSAVELGKKDVPSHWFNLITSTYKLNTNQRDELEEAIELSKGSVKINLKDMKSDNKKLAIAFARKLNIFDEDDIDDIMEIISKK